MTKDFTNLTNIEKEDLIEEIYDLAYNYEQKYGNCTQCTLGAIKSTFGIIDDSAFKASHGLSGGIGLTSQATCGAVVAGIMTISSIEGREWSEMADGDKPHSYKLSRDLIDKFKNKYSGIKCHEIQKDILGKSYNLSKKDEFKAFIEAGGFIDKCTAVVGDGAKFIAEMILNGEMEI